LSILTPDNLHEAHYSFQAKLKAADPKLLRLLSYRNLYGLKMV